VAPRGAARPGDGTRADGRGLQRPRRRRHPDHRDDHDIYDAAPYGYVIEKEQTEFAQAVADAVAALISDGTYTSVLQKWGVEAGGIDDPAVNP
jgi:ABC-type amino acid transport substrate-binding protein